MDGCVAGNLDVVNDGINTSYGQYFSLSLGDAEEVLGSLAE